MPTGTTSSTAGTTSTGSGTTGAGTAGSAGASTGTPPPPQAITYNIVEQPVTGGANGTTTFTYTKDASGNITSITIVGQALK
ncbi:MAG: hypothetical protein ACREFQ_19225, partial [Stellaceae bacterium]